ncbi:hypothetical protein LOK49_LG06G01794 [Camellia lanceoleosa]|uniref:Uncharacterized protein n=1 Tax=Camellia lanceoleosa TaxID=1840588 RepID=A0ACC0HAD8_9ERIC|nr:hypothetical protein LOK49_LG06G01794 [Camellia lanceoleosa]
MGCIEGEDRDRRIHTLRKRSMEGVADNVEGEDRFRKKRSISERVDRFKWESVFGDRFVEEAYGFQGEAWRSEDYYNGIVGILGKISNVQHLELSNGIPKVGELCLWSGEPKSVPKCLSLCMEAIEFSGFAGCKEEMKLIGGFNLKSIVHVIYNSVNGMALMMDQSSKLRDSKEKDRISNLPDHILSHILRFMPTKYAAPTTYYLPDGNSFGLKSTLLT